LNRVRTLLVFAAIAVCATVFAACGSSSSDTSDEKPQEVLKGASFEGIESADLDLTAGVDVSGDEGGHVDLSASGPFQAGEKNQPPELDMTVESSGSVGGEDLDFEGGLTLVPNKAFIAYKGTEYEVDPTTFSFVEQAINQAQEEGGGAEESTACQKAAGGLQPSEFVDNLKNEGSEEVGGADTTKVSGDLDVSSAIDALQKLSENPACASQLESAGPLPLGELEESRSEVEDAIKTAHADVYVGDDKIIRRLSADISLQPKGSSETVELKFDVTLNDVNEGQEITPPADAQPLEGLFQKLGVNPLELLEATQGGNGIQGLLEGLGSSGGGLGSALGEIEGSGSGSNGGGGSGHPSVPGAEDLGEAPKAYLECVQGAKTPVELQQCVKKLQ
jgi:hypothetical protein